ncbi:MAG: chorismate-binding protein [bacterium]|nr:chorismate-binding protein [bacterium]
MARALLAEAQPALAAPVPPATAARQWRIAAAAAPAVWRRRVARTLVDVAAGRLEKLVLARAVSVTADAPLVPLRVLARLRAAHPECTTFGVAHGGTWFVGATPERLARVYRGRIETAAVAGTAARGAAPAALLASTKERAEHAFVVDALRARLAPLTRDLAGPAEPMVVAAGEAQHLRTPLSGTLRPGRGLFRGRPRCT